MTVWEFCPEYPWKDRIVNHKKTGLYIFLLCLLLVSAVTSLVTGAVPLTWTSIWNETQSFFASGHPSSTTAGTILFTIRLPRTLLCILTGMGLALVGLLMQTITRNDLADPYILGVSSGASTGAVAAIILGWFGFLGAYNITAGAFLGAMLATGLSICFVGRSSSPVKLILIGTGISALFSALTMLIIYSAKHEAMVRSAMFWLLGSLSGVQWNDLTAALSSVVILLFFIWQLRHELDILLLGEQEAEQMGLSVKQMQLLVVMISSLVISVLVAKVGVIGFVGLIVPHLARLLTGAKHSDLMPLSALIGAIVLLWGDILSRYIFRPEEVPIGVLTACIGAPVFIWMITRRYGDE